MQSGEGMVRIKQVDEGGKIYGREGDGKDNLSLCSLLLRLVIIGGEWGGEGDIFIVRGMYKMQLKNVGNLENSTVRDVI